MRLVAVSDVSVGFGSPQLPALVRSIRDTYVIAESVVIEPDEPDRKAAAAQFADFRLIRVHSVAHPHSATGRIEYITEASRIVQTLRPDVLILATTFTLPVLFHLRYRPHFVIYYQLEPVEPYGRFDMRMNRRIAELVDLVVYPEENRAAHDIRLFGDRRKPFEIVYNCAPYEGPAPRAPDARDPRLVYFGTVEEGRTFAEYFTDPRMRDVPLDVFGPITGPAAAETRWKMSQMDGQVRYLGNVDARTLAERRVSYAFSLVAWNPIDPAHWAAAPNKFFESIAAGVPPIAAPHPQCQMLVDRYGLGIVMNDWALDSFLDAIRRGLILLKTKMYADMVEQCRVAVSRELNWDTQFRKLTPHIDAALRERVSA